jgi:hypothetical protein
MVDFLESDIITTDGYLEIVRENSERLCYIKTDYFKNGKVPFFWRSKNHPTEFKRNVIIGHSDHSVEDPDLNGFDLVFCVNKNTSDPRVHSIPLGLPNYCDDLPILEILGDKKIVSEISKEKRDKINLAYINFSMETFPEERKNIIEQFVGSHWVSKQKMDSSRSGREKYLVSLKESKFCFCPRGNGIDTHRMWESLYMGCIPIVKKYHTHDFCDDLPVLFVDEWSQINESYLQEKWEEYSNREWNYEKLKLPYWKKFIENKIAE